MSNSLVFYKGVITPLFLVTNKDIDEDELSIYFFDEEKEEWEQIEKNFIKLDSYYYKVDLKFDEIGTNLIKILYKDEIVSDGVIKVVENLIERLVNLQFGNWEIKNQQMIFYDLNGNELAKYNLYDKAGNPTELGVVKRVKQ